MFCYVDLDDPVTGIGLPASAPRGYPHQNKLEDIYATMEKQGRQIHMTGLLFAVDTVASVLYKWKPEALRELLDLEKYDFEWKYYTEDGYFAYVIRKGRNVKVNSPSS